MFQNDLNISSQPVIKLTTNYIELARVTMSYYELLTTKEKLDRTDSYPLMSMVVIGLSRNLVYKIPDQDNGKIMRTWVDLVAHG